MKKLEIFQVRDAVSLVSSGCMGPRPPGLRILELCQKAPRKIVSPPS